MVGLISRFNQPLELSPLRLLSRHAGAAVAEMGRLAVVGDHRQAEGMALSAVGVALVRAAVAVGLADLDLDAGKRRTTGEPLVAMARLGTKRAACALAAIASVGAARAVIGTGRLLDADSAASAGRTAGAVLGDQAAGSTDAARRVRRFIAAVALANRVVDAARRFDAGAGSVAGVAGAAVFATTASTAAFPDGAVAGVASASRIVFAGRFGHAAVLAVAGQAARAVRALVAGCAALARLRVTSKASARTRVGTGRWAAIGSCTVDRCAIFRRCAVDGDCRVANMAVARRLVGCLAVEREAGVGGRPIAGLDLTFATASDQTGE